MPKPPKPSIDHFPLFQHEDYDFNFQFPWPVGLKSTYDEELIRRVSSAMLSFFLGNRSIDYIYKRYGRNSEYSTTDGTRLDLLITKEIRNYTRSLGEAIAWTSTTRDKRLGEGMDPLAGTIRARLPYKLREQRALFRDHSGRQNDS
jgi:hypothetical protein